MRWNVELRKVYNVLKIYQHVQYMEVVQDGRRRRRAPGVATWAGQALRSDAFVGFREGQLPLVNYRGS